MKRLRFQSGVGNGTATIPNGQITGIGMVPGANGSWVQIANSGPIWVPPNVILDLRAGELAMCCGVKECDQYPGDVQIQIVFGQNVQLPEGEDTGDEPASWMVIYNGC